MPTLQPLFGAPLNTILVPTDFSSGAGAALARALLVPHAQRARLHLVHVLPDELPDAARARATADAARRLEQVAARARRPAGKRPEVTCEVLVGHPFVQIIRCSRATGADLIVLGRHGRRPVRDMFIGSTAARVIRKGDVPVLAVSRRPGTRYRRPLVATDCADASRRTFELALRLLGEDVAAVRVVHALHVPFEELVTRAASAQGKQAYRETYRERARAGVEALLAPYRELTVKWQIAVRSGDPRSVILTEALRRSADLVALGTHARSGIAHALLGSVAEWVIAAAPCDVLVARPVRFGFELP